MPKNRSQYSSAKAAKSWLAGHAWVPHTAELIASPAWRARSIYAVRLIDRLELEHMAHAGKENGYLRLTWEQMCEAGISKRFIASTIAEAVALGLVRVDHRGSYRGGARNDPTLYRLTYLPVKFVPATGAPIYQDPTNDWRAYRGKSARPKNRLNGSLCELIQGQHVNQSADAADDENVVKLPLRTRFDARRL
jgi:hypothetical protein